MHTPVYGRPEYTLREVDSTNLWARRALAQAVLPDGALFRADFQRSGRGQRGKSWQAPLGENFLGTWVKIQPGLKADEAFRLSAWMALAVQAVAVDLLPGKTVQVKWPNDILVEGRKLAGMLVEHLWQGQVIQASLLGLGMNVGQTDFPAELATPATS